MPTAGTTHHVVLNGVGYMLNQDAHGLKYKRSEVPFLVPRRGDEAGRQALTIPSVASGPLVNGVGDTFGEGYYTAADGVDGRAGDGLRCAGQLTSVTGGAVQFNSFADFNGTVYAAGQTGSTRYLYKYSAGSFSELAGAALGAMARVVPFANYLWWARSSGAVGTVGTADTVTAASGLNSANIVDVGRAGTRLLGVLAAGATRAVRWFGVGADVPPTTNFTTANEDGDPQETLRRIASLGETFYIGKADGLYKVTLDTTPSVTLTCVADHRARRDTSNFSALAEWGGALYYNVLDRLYRWDGSSEEDVSPPQSLLYTGGYTQKRHVVKRVAGGSRCLWCLSEADDGNNTVVLWAYDGEHWHMLRQIASAVGAAAGELHYSPNVDKLLINYYTGAAWATVSMPCSTMSDLPSGSFASSGNRVYLPFVDAGLPEVTKQWLGVSVRCIGITLTQVKVYHWYNSAWALLGTIDATTGGEVLFSSVIAGAVTGKRLYLYLDLIGVGGATPVVYEVAVSYLPLPAASTVVEFETVLGPNVRLMDGSAESNSPSTLLSSLETCRAAGTIVTLFDPITTTTGGGAKYVRVSEVEVKTLKPSKAGGAYGLVASVRCEVVA